MQSDIEKRKTNHQRTSIVWSKEEIQQNNCDKVAIVLAALLDCDTRKILNTWNECPRSL